MSVSIDQSISLVMLPRESWSRLTYDYLFENYFRIRAGIVTFNTGIDYAKMMHCGFVIRQQFQEIPTKMRVGFSLTHISWYTL